jgi:hypothetical protein
MRNMGIFVVSALCTIMVGAADARSPRAATRYDGEWNLFFATRAGSCDPTYDFDGWGAVRSPVQNERWRD